MVVTSSQCGINIKVNHMKSSNFNNHGTTVLSWGTLFGVIETFKDNTRGQSRLYRPRALSSPMLALCSCIHPATQLMGTLSNHQTGSGSKGLKIFEFSFWGSSNETALFDNFTANVSNFRLWCSKLAGPSDIELVTFRITKRMGAELWALILLWCNVAAHVSPGGTFVLFCHC